MLHWIVSSLRPLRFAAFPANLHCSSHSPDREILSGRPFGGLGIMWRKSLGSCITIEKYDDHRLKAVQFDNGSCTLLAVNIHICRMMIGMFEAQIMTSI